MAREDQPAPLPRRAVLVSIAPADYSPQGTYQLFLIGPSGRFWTTHLQNVPPDLAALPGESFVPPPSAVVFLTTDAAAIAAGIDR